MKIHKKVVLKFKIKMNILKVEEILHVINIHINLNLILNAEWTLNIINWTIAQLVDRFYMKETNT